MTDPLAFLEGGGEASRMIRERDWNGHPLGAPAGWPAEFKAALSLVLNSPESMILAWGPELSFFFNETYFPLLGPRLPWAMGERFDKVWADGWEQAKPIIDAAFAGRSERFVDLPWKLGEDRGARDTWWTFSYSRVLDARGEVAGLFIFTNETTDRVLSDAALRRSEERFRALTHATSDGLYRMSADWKELRALDGRGVLADTGSPSVQWMDTYLLPEDQPAIQKVIDEALRTKATFQLEHRVRQADGSLGWTLSRAIPIFDEQGGITEWFGTASDITERVQAVEALSRLNASLEAEVAKRIQERDRIWQTTNDLMGTATLDGYLKAVNPAWTQLLGWTEEELLRRPFLEIVDEADHAVTADVVRGLGQGHTVTGFVNHVIARDGTRRAIMWTAVPEKGNDLFYIVGRDLTEQRAAEDQLRQAQKMEAVGQLTGGLAHDFNNLLAGISGALELMSLRVAQGRLTDIERYVAAAQGAARRAAALTHRLLAFSRRQTLDPRPTNVNALMDGMSELIQRAVGPSIAVETVGAIGLWPALVDASQLENALLNLCINARDAMPDGGRITIETANRWLDRDAGRAYDMPEGQYLSLSVTDTGAGMSPEVIARVFEPFFTTKPIGQGTGLGLSMIYGFAQQSGGQVRIHSGVGQGTTVTIYLPRHHGEAVQDESGLEPAPAAFAQVGETVLIVDDEPTVRLLASEVLCDLGYAVIEAADSIAGLKLLRSDARIDLLVTDVGLPGGMNGRQMADAGRVVRPGLKTLFITGYAENAALGDGHLEPGMQVLTKPFAVEALAARIRDLMKM